MESQIIISNCKELDSSTPLNNLESEFTRYLDAYLDVGSAQTIATYQRNLHQFFKYLAENAIAQPTRTDVLSYKQYLIDKGCKNTTVQSYITIVKLFFNWTEQEGLYPNVAEHIKGAKIPSGFKKDTVSSSQVKSILNHMDIHTEAEKRDKAIIALMSVCGLRCIEVVRANIEDLRVVADNTVLYVQGKGHQDKDDYVKVPKSVESLLRDYLSSRPSTVGSAPLFTSCSNHNNEGRLSTHSVSRMVKTNLKANGIISDKITAHSLRHFAVTSAIIAGESLQDAKEFARHASINTTMIYNHSIEKSHNNCSTAVSNLIFG